MKLLGTFLLSVLAWMPVQTHALPVYDAAADFSFSSNPNGPWQYGRETSLGGALSLYTTTFAPTSGPFAGLQFWGTGANIDPNVMHNPTSATVLVASTSVLSGQLSLHPGPSNEYSVVRFVVPTTGSYQLNSSFNMRSFAGTNSTDVHVLLNNNTVSQLYSGTVSGFNDTDFFNSVLSLSAGDLLDFAVGPNGSVPGQSYLGDTTQLTARLELRPQAVPVPATLLLLLLGLSVMGALRLRQA